VVPTLAKNARMGHPLSWFTQQNKKVGHPPNEMKSLVHPPLHTSSVCAESHSVRQWSRTILVARTFRFEWKEY
jgi:hypothetical protein